MNITITSLTTICVSNHWRRSNLTLDQPHKGAHLTVKRKRQGICNLQTEEGMHRNLKISAGRIALAHVTKSPIKQFHLEK
jgi:hypothetical protein